MHGKLKTIAFTSRFERCIYRIIRDGFAFPKLEFCFLLPQNMLVEWPLNTERMLTEKSATFSFLFFALFGIF